MASGLRSDMNRAHIALDKLERQSVVLDRWGHAYQLLGVYWYEAGSDDGPISSFQLAQRAPIKTVFTAPKIDSLVLVNE